MIAKSTSSRNESPRCIEIPRVPEEVEGTLTFEQPRVCAHADIFLVLRSLCSVASP